VGPFLIRDLRFQPVPLCARSFIILLFRPGFDLFPSIRFFFFRDPKLIRGLFVSSAFENWRVLRFRAHFLGPVTSFRPDGFHVAHSLFAWPFAPGSAAALVPLEPQFVFDSGILVDPECQALSCLLSCLYPYPPLRPPL